MGRLSEAIKQKIDGASVRGRGVSCTAGCRGRHRADKTKRGDGGNPPLAVSHFLIAKTFPELHVLLPTTSPEVCKMLF